MDRKQNDEEVSMDSFEKHEFQAKIDANENINGINYDLLNEEHGYRHTGMNKSVEMTSSSHKRTLQSITITQE